MHTYNCKVRLGGQVLDEVRKNAVTAAEIMVLRKFHGEDAVLEIKAVGSDNRSHAEERQRLYRNYASVEDNVGGTALARIAAIREMFGPDHTPLPVKLSDVGGEEPEAAAPKPRRTRVVAPAGLSSALA